jgi:hypothetical protein
VEIEAVFSKAVQVIAWDELQDDGFWWEGGLSEHQLTFLA